MIKYLIITILIPKQMTYDESHCTKNYKKLRTLFR